MPRPITLFSGLTKTKDMSKHTPAHLAGMPFFYPCPPPWANLGGILGPQRSPLEIVNDVWSQERQMYT